MDNNLREFENFQSEIIGKPPNKITRIGISFIFIFLIIVLVFAWIIDYSDTISARIVVNSSNPTVIVQAEHYGVINKVFKKNGSLVNKDDNIVTFMSGTNLDTVNSLLDYLVSNTLLTTVLVPFQTNALGDLREDFQSLFGLIEKYQAASDKSMIKLKNEKLTTTNDSLNKQLIDLRKQKKLFLKKLKIQKNEFSRSIELSKKKLISNTKLDNTKSNYIDSQISLNQLDLEISKIESTLLNNSTQIDLINLENKNTQQHLGKEIESRKNILIDKIYAWKRKNTIKTPISGQISFTNSIQPYQNITQNQEMFSITPFANNLIGKLKIPENGSGKIFKGQSVRIKLDSFPYNEFGVINGRIISKSKSVLDASIYIEVEILNYDSIKKNIITSYNQEVVYIPNMQGQAEIITNKKSVLARIFENLTTEL